MGCCDEYTGIVLLWTSSFNTFHVRWSTDLSNSHIHSGPLLRLPNETHQILPRSHGFLKALFEEDTQNQTESGVRQFYSAFRERTRETS